MTLQVALQILFVSQMPLPHCRLIGEVTTSISGITVKHPAHTISNCSTWFAVLDCWRIWQEKTMLSRKGLLKIGSWFCSRPEFRSLGLESPGCRLWGTLSLRTGSGGKMPGNLRGPKSATWMKHIRSSGWHYSHKEGSPCRATHIFKMAKSPRVHWCPCVHAPVEGPHRGLDTPHPSKTQAKTPAR